MTDTRRTLLLNALKLLDIAVMMAAFGVAALFVLDRTQNVSADAFFSMRIKVQNFVIFSLFLAAWHAFFKAFSLYESRRLSNCDNEYLQIAKATTAGALLILAGTLVLRIALVTPAFLAIFYVASTLATMFIRALLRGFLRLIRKRGRNLRDIVIVGTGRRARAIARLLESRPDAGYRVVGFVDRQWPGLDAFRAHGYSLICDLDHFPQFLRNTVVDEVFLALPMRSMHEQASQIAICCEEQGVTFRLLPEVLDLKAAQLTAGEVEGDPVITHSPTRAALSAVLVKRVFDIVISFVVLLISAPLLCAVAIAIKVTSPGSILFVQRRVGLNKRPFKLYKLRSMVTDAEERVMEIAHLNEVSGPVFKIANDPRITRIGRLLRRSSIDELPQLFNVLKGDMSLVGPRPLPIRDYSGFSQDWQRRRFSVKPGITCLWQIGGRSSIPFEKWMELDLQYIDRWSLGLDFKILLRTIPAVLRGTGAA